MSTPTNGSWNDTPGNPEGSGQQSPQLGQQYGQQGQSIGQSFGQPEQGGQGYGQPEQGAPAAPGAGQYGSGQQHSGPQPGMQQGGQQGGFGQHPGQHGQGTVGNAGQAIGGAGDGIGDLFSDFAFKKSLTEKIASMAFLVTVVWAVIRFIQTLAHAWGSQDFGGTSVKNMGGFEATMSTLSALVALVLVVAVARLLLELFINVARIATRNRG